MKRWFRNGMAATLLVCGMTMVQGASGTGGVVWEGLGCHGRSDAGEPSLPDAMAPP